MYFIVYIEREGKPSQNIPYKTYIDWGNCWQNCAKSEANFHEIKLRTLTWNESVNCNLKVDYSVCCANKCSTFIYTKKKKTKRVFPLFNQLISVSVFAIQSFFFCNDTQYWNLLAIKVVWNYFCMLCFWFSSRNKAWCLLSGYIYSVWFIHLQTHPLTLTCTHIYTITYTHN